MPLTQADAFDCCDDLAPRTVSKREIRRRAPAAAHRTGQPSHRALIAAPDPAGLSSAVRFEAKDAPAVLRDSHSMPSVVHELHAGEGQPHDDEDRQPQAIDPPTALATEIAITIPTHVAIMRIAMLSIALVVSCEPLSCPDSCRCAISTIACRRMVSESAPGVPAPRTDRPRGPGHPGQDEEPARCCGKNASTLPAGHPGIDRGNVEAPTNWRFDANPGSCGCVSFYRRIGESFEAPEKTLPPADFVPRPGWQSHRDAKRVQGGSRDTKIVQPKVPSWPRRKASEVRSKERVDARRRL